MSCQKQLTVPQNWKYNDKVKLKEQSNLMDSNIQINRQNRCKQRYMSQEHGPMEMC